MYLNIAQVARFTRECLIPMVGGGDVGGRSTSRKKVGTALEGLLTVIGVRNS